MCTGFIICCISIIDRYAVLLCRIDLIESQLPVYRRYVQFLQDFPILQIKFHWPEKRFRTMFFYLTVQGEWASVVRVNWRFKDLFGYNWNGVILPSSGWKTPDSSCKYGPETEQIYWENLWTLRLSKVIIVQYSTPPNSEYITEIKEKKKSI